jgi:hypothetical protein
MLSWKFVVQGSPLLWGSSSDGLQVRSMGACAASVCIRNTEVYQVGQAGALLWVRLSV